MPNLSKMTLRLITIAACLIAISLWLIQRSLRSCFLMDGPSIITVTFNKLPPASSYRFQLLIPEFGTDESIDYFLDCEERTTTSPIFCDGNGSIKTRFFIYNWKNAPKRFQLVAHIDGKSFKGDFSPEFDAREINGPGCEPIIYSTSITFPDIQLSPQSNGKVAVPL